MFLAIERNKLRSFWLGSHHDMMTSYHVCIEAMHGLSVCHHDVVGNIHYVIDRTKADNLQFVLQPFRTFLHVAIGYAQANVSLAGLCILDSHFDRHVVIIYRECITIRTMQRCLITVLHEPSI